MKSIEKAAGTKIQPKLHYKNICTNILYKKEDHTKNLLHENSFVYENLKKKNTKNFV